MSGASSGLLFSDLVNSVLRQIYNVGKRTMLVTAYGGSVSDTKDLMYKQLPIA